MPAASRERSIGRAMMLRERRRFGRCGNSKREEDRE
jgi:hypothetical protein